MACLLALPAAKAAEPGPFDSQRPMEAGRDVGAGNIAQAIEPVNTDSSTRRYLPPQFIVSEE